MENTIALPERPGSLNDFLRTSPDATVEDYYCLLDSYRFELAKTIGVTAVDLHEMGNDQIKQKVQQLQIMGGV